MTSYTIEKRDNRIAAVLTVLLLIMFTAVLGPAPAAAEGEHVQTQEAADAGETLRGATKVYRDMWAAADRKIPASVVANARCVVVIPGLTTGAVVLGGSHGQGVASCKTDDSWSHPAFVTMNEVSLGAQLGARTTDLVLFVVDQAGETALKHGELTMAGDLSVTAGTYDQGFDASDLGMVGYASSAGAYIGASVASGNVAADDYKNAVFYGTSVSTTSLLASEVDPPERELANEFVALLP